MFAETIADKEKIIIELMAENAKLKAALGQIADRTNWYYEGGVDDPRWTGDGVPWELARKALED